MDILLHCVPDTGEPVGVWFEEPGSGRKCHYVDERLLERGRERIVDGSPADLPWAEICAQVARSSPHVDGWRKKTEVDDPEAALETERRRWAGVTSPTSSAAWVAAARRTRFRSADAPALATAVLGAPARPWPNPKRYPAMHQLYGNSSDTAIAVLVPSREAASDVDAALATGLAAQGDRDLYLVLPDDDRQVRASIVEPVWEATWRRLPFIVTPVQLWVHADRAVTAKPPPPRHDAFTRTRQDATLATGIHDLAERTSWVRPLTAWAERHPALDAAHRPSYLAWHVDGRQVLQVRRSRGGVRVTAGVNYSEHRRDVTELATTRDLSGILTSADLETLQAAVERAVKGRTAGDVENLEHMLQARLASEPSRTTLGLTKVLRELPATRPGSRRAFIDLLGVDTRGNIRIIETKLGRDRMLGLQGLDYWVWASEHRPELVAEIRSHGGTVKDAPRIYLDFLVGTRDDATAAPDLRLLVPQLEALDGQISWRIGIIRGWRQPGAELEVRWIGRGDPVPADVGRDGEPRFAWRLEAQLRADAVRRGVSTRGPFIDAATSAVVPAALPDLETVVASGQAHRYLHHVRSSQAFALNLFGGLQPAQLVTVAKHVAPDIETCRPPIFEYSDPADDLQEATHASPHSTQVDVRLDCRTNSGQMHTLLIEVKLSEDGFGGCSAAESHQNDRTDLCSTAQPFGGDTDGCFQLRNHDREHRRLYDHFLDIDKADGGRCGCPYRTLNQPMRNVALAGALIARGEADHVTVVLCAHDEHAAIWRRWDEATRLLPWTDRISAASLPASTVLAARGEVDAHTLAERYQL